MKGRKEYIKEDAVVLLRYLMDLAFQNHQSDTSQLPPPQKMFLLAVKSSISGLGDRIQILSEMLWHEFFYGTEELPSIFILILFSNCDFICILLFRDIFILVVLMFR